MIECDICEEWYHCSCLNIARLPRNIHLKTVDFKCGQKGCNDGKTILKVFTKTKGKRKEVFTYVKGDKGTEESVKRQKVHCNEEIVNNDILTSSNSENSNNDNEPKLESGSDTNHNNVDELNKLDKEAIEEILKIKLPNEYFTSNLPVDMLSFMISNDDLLYLRSIHNGRRYKTGKWQEVFIKGIKQSNQHCVFIFDRHQISSAKKRQKKANSPFFKTTGRCKFTDCPVKVSLKMMEQGQVFVQYENNIKHNIHEQHSRPITGRERENLKDIFKRGEKPLNEYLKRSMHTEKEQILSGNNDGFGKDTHVFRQIASESRQVGRLDKNVLTSMIELMADMKKNGIGFIQKICAKPNYILYWSEEGLGLYHKLAKDCPLYWDATGSVVRKNEDGKRYLYYELSIKNPVKGKMGIPLTAMISEEQSLPTILDWLTSFQHAEKKRYGHSNICQPKLIVSDEAWVFILTALKVFNTETLQEFLERSWRMLNGNALVNDVKKTIVHLCASHFMNKVKRFCHTNYKKNLRLGLYMISLLMNSKTIEEAEEVLHDICVTLQSPTIGSNNKFFIERLLRKINTFDTAVDGTEINTDGTDISNENIQPGRYSEDDFLTLATESPFKSWGRRISNVASQKIPTDGENNKNQYHSDAFLHTILTKYIPIFPLWTSISISGIPFSKTQSSIENRFRILKSINLDSRKNGRLDDFSVELYNNTVAVQKMIAKDSLKTHFKRTATKSTETIKESWNKTQKQSKNLKGTQGHFQRAPEKKFTYIPVSNISHENKEFNGMRNIGSTCWFNSMIQALNNSDTSKRYIDELARLPVNLDSDSEKQNQVNVYQSIVNILKFMANQSNSGKEVPRQMLVSALQSISEFDQTFKGLARQQDAYEFYTKVISKISKTIGEKLVIEQEYTCKKCKSSTFKNDEHIQEIELHIPDDKNVSVSSLIEEYFNVSNFGCCSVCSDSLTVSQHLTTTPKTLILILKRYIYNKQSGCATKIDKSVHIDKSIDISNLLKDNCHTEYNLKSVICHHGRSYNTGHYTTYVFDTNGEFKKLNDLSISGGYIQETEKSCYVLVYDLQRQPLPVYIEPLIRCLALTKGMKLINNDKRFENSSVIQKKLFNALKDGICTEEVKQLIGYAVEKVSGDFSLFEGYDFVIHILEYFFSSDKISDLSFIGAELFKLIFEVVEQCHKCKAMKIRKSQTMGLLSLSQCNASFVANIIKTAAKKTEICDCNESDCTMHITSLPHTFIIFLHTTNNVNITDVLDLDLAEQLPTPVPLISKKYALSSALARTGQAFVSLKRSGSNLLSLNSMDEGNVTDLSLYDDILLFFDLKSDMLCIQNNTHPSNFLQYLKCLKIPAVKFHIPVVHSDSTDLRAARNISKDNYWLSSDDINLFMGILLNNAQSKIHAVDSGWASHRLFMSGSLSNAKWAFFETENKNISWGSFTIIFIPVNIENRHWVLIVVDIENDILYYCDPQGNRADIIVFQILKYISYDILVHSGKIKPVKDWNICYYCESKYFPKQSDGNSCGIYVCQISKAILFNRKLPFLKDLPKSMRHQIANEILQKNIEY